MAHHTAGWIRYVAASRSEVFRFVAGRWGSRGIGPDEVFRCGASALDPWRSDQISDNNARFKRHAPPQPAPDGSVDEATSDNNVAAPEPLGSEGKIQTPPEDAELVTALLSDQGLASLLSDEGLPGETAARHVPATTSGKNSEIGSGNHLKGHRLSKETPVPPIQTDASQVVPDGASIIFALAFQPPAATTSVPPPLPDAAGVPAAPVDAAVGGKPGDPHHAGPAAADKSRSGSTDHAADATLASAASSVASGQEKTVRTDAVPDAGTYHASRDTSVVFVRRCRSGANEP